MIAVVFTQTNIKIELIQVRWWHLRNNDQVGGLGHQISQRGQPCHLSCYPPRLTSTRAQSQRQKHITLCGVCSDAYPGVSAPLLPASGLPALVSRDKPIPTLNHEIIFLQKAARGSQLPMEMLFKWFPAGSQWSHRINRVSLLPTSFLHKYLG